MPFYVISTEIDAYWSTLWDTDFMLHPDLHLPEENQFIGKQYKKRISFQLHILPEDSLAIAWVENKLSMNTVVHRGLFPDLTLSTF